MPMIFSERLFKFRESIDILTGILYYLVDFDFIVLINK